MSMKMIISKEEKERFYSYIRKVIENFPHEKVSRHFEMSFEMVDLDCNDEDELGEIYDGYKRLFHLVYCLYFPDIDHFRLKNPK